MKRMLSWMLCVLAGAVPAQPSTLDPPVWDLSGIYADDAAAARDRDRLLGLIANWRSAPVVTVTSGEDLGALLGRIAELRRLATRLASYGNLRVETDFRSPQANQLYNAGTAFEPEIEALVRPAESIILAEDDATLKRWMAETPSVMAHGRRLRRLMFERPWRLDAGREALLAAMLRWPRLSADAHEKLLESDLGWPQIEIDGQKQSLDPGAFVGLRTHADRAVRERANAAMYQHLAGLEDAFAVLYVRRVEADLIQARARGMQSSADAQWLMRDGHRIGVREQMVRAARAAWPTLQRALQVRHRILGMESPRYGDLYQLHPDLPQQIPYATALEIAHRVHAPMGKAWLERLDQRIAAGWTHLAPSPNKRGTFAIFPPTEAPQGAEEPPAYLLLTYSGTYRNARTLVAALGSMMRHGDERELGLSDTRDDPPVAGNGLLYANAMMFDDDQMALARGATRQAIAVNAIDQLRAQLFRWALAIELDQQVEDLIRRGEQPSGAQVSALWLALLRACYEPAGITVDAEFGREWMLENVAFAGYEHQYWAPAMTVAALLAEDIRGEGPAAKTATKALGGLEGRMALDRSDPMLKEIGIDLMSPEAYRGIQARLERLISILEP